MKLPARIYKELLTRINNGYYSFDPWGLKETRAIYDALEDLFKDGHKAVSINGKVYALSYKKGGGCGMGAYPSEYRLELIDKIGIIKGE